MVQVVDADGSGMVGLFQHTALQIVDSDVVRFCKVERIAYTLGGQSLHTVDTVTSANSVCGKGCREICDVGREKCFGCAVRGCSGYQQGGICLLYTSDAADD